MLDSNDRLRLLPLDPNRLQESFVTRDLPDGTRFSIEKIRQMTGAAFTLKPPSGLLDDADEPTVELDQDLLMDSDEEPELLAPDHIFFYKPGNLPVFDGEREDFYTLLKSSSITLVLNVCIDCPIPNAWIAALEELRQEYSVFNFIRLQDIHADNSHAMVYINGNPQNEGFSLSHSQSLCLSGVALINLIEPIIWDHLANLHSIKKTVSDEVEGVIHQGTRVKINFPQVEDRPVEAFTPVSELASIPVSHPPRETDPTELIERKWAGKSSNW